MPDTWILVADQARARLLRLRPAAHGLEEIGAYANPEARVPGHALERARRPSRVHERFGEVRHAMEPRTAVRDKSATRFAAILGDVLARGLDTQQYRRLALIAPPRFLGTLNAALGAGPRAAVVLKVPKNLTRRSHATILAQVPRSLWRRDVRAVMPPKAPRPMAPSMPPARLDRR